MINARQPASTFSSRCLVLCSALLAIAPSQAETIVVDNGTPQVSTSPGWGLATGATAHFGTISEYASTGGAVDVARFTPNLTRPGKYRVEAWNSCYSPRATDVPHEVVHTGGATATVVIDQDPSTGTCAEWALLGVFEFDAGIDGYVEISDDGVTGGPYIGANAVRFTLLDVLALDHAYTDPNLLFLEGRNIQPGEPLTVLIGNDIVTVDSVSTTEIVVFLPGSLLPGTHVVTVVNGFDTAQLDLTLGAVGPEARQAQQALTALRVHRARQVLLVRQGLLVRRDPKGLKGPPAHPDQATTSAITTQQPRST